MDKEQLEELGVSFKGVTNEGKEIEGICVRGERVECEGMHTYHLRTSDYENRIATIERNVVVNFFGTLLTEEELVISPKDYISLDKTILNGIPYQTQPQLIRVDGGDTLSAEEREAIGQENIVREDYKKESGWYIVVLKSDYATADRIVDGMNSSISFSSDVVWCRNDEYEDYLDN